MALICDLEHLAERQPGRSSLPIHRDELRDRRRDRQHEIDRVGTLRTDQAPPPGKHGNKPFAPTSHPTRARAGVRGGRLRPGEVGMVPPVTKAPPVPSGRPSRSSTHRSATSSTAVAAGVTVRSPAFWSHAEVNQSAAMAAGCVPPMTNPKNRPDGIAVSPGSTAWASMSTTATGSVGPSGSSAPRAATTSASEAVGGTARSGRVPSHLRRARERDSRGSAAIREWSTGHAPQVV